MKINIRQSILVLLMATVIGSSNNSYGAIINNLYELPPNNKLLQQFSFIQEFSKTKPVSAASPYQLYLISQEVIEPGILQERYAEYYKNIPVRGYEVIIQKTINSQQTLSQGNETLLSVNGKLARNLEMDLQQLQATISPVQALQIAQTDFVKQHGATTWNYANIVNQLIIYIPPDDSNNFAKFCYRLSFTASAHQITELNQPVYIIDANSGSIEKSWNDIQSNEIDNNEIGEGPGGFQNNYAYHPNQYYFGKDENNSLPQLGKFEVKLNNGECITESNFFRVVSLNNEIFDSQKIENTKSLSLPSFIFTCTNNHFSNSNDNGQAPINGAVSPVNNAMFFSQQIYHMMQTKFVLRFPFGQDLPIPIMVHIGNLENAYSFATVKDEVGKIKIHNQLWLGNGLERSSAFVSADVIAHELAHLYTNSNSRLEYHDQSGAISESFADISSIGFRDYFQQLYPWYHYDWTIGLSIAKDAKPLRYFAEPTLDGKSIASTQAYVAGMNPHYASGIFNKAFYLMCVKYGLSVPTVYRIFVFANKKYWTPTISFNEAACGIIHQAHDFELSVEDISKIILSFNEVGVKCDNPNFDSSVTKN